MSAFVALGPDKEDDPPAPEAEALKPLLTVAFPIVFFRGHVGVEDRFKLCEVDSMLAKVRSAFRLVPRDHDSNRICEQALGQAGETADDVRTNTKGLPAIQPRHRVPRLSSRSQSETGKGKSHG